MFEPDLPDDLRRALAVWKTGSVIKLVIRYQSAFWRAGGKSGMTTWRDLPGLFACEQSRDPSQPALVAFVGGPLARDWGAQGEAFIRSQVLDRLAAAHGPEALDPLDVILRDWTDDPFSGGGYADTVADREARDAEAKLRAGAGVIRFASSELSPSFPGYVEGALVIGRLVANEVADGL